MPSTLQWLINACVVLTFFLGNLWTTNGQSEFYPGFRRAPPIAEWPKDVEPIDTEDYQLQELADVLNEQRELQRLEQRLNPPFTYRFPNHPPSSSSKSSRPFAIDPSDPRYYLKTPIIPDYNTDIVEDVGDENTELEQEEIEQFERLTDQQKLEEQRRHNEEQKFLLQQQLQLQQQRREQQQQQQQVQQKPPVQYSRPLSRQHKLQNGDFVRGDGTSNGVRIVPAEISVEREKEAAGLYIIAMLAGISAAASVGLIAFGIGWYNLQKSTKAAADVEYPAYGVTGPHKDVSPSGDRRLAQSAHMYHYQHQKQQIIAMERAANERHGSMSEADSDEENEEGDYTVYECPGLAPTGEMEVKNPLFQDDPTPATTSTVENETVTTPTVATGDVPDLK